jgi:hypothetical protein
VSSYSESVSSLSRAGSPPHQGSLPSPSLGSLPQTQSYVYKNAGLTVSYQRKYNLVICSTQSCPVRDCRRLTWHNSTAVKCTWQPCRH